MKNRILLSIGLICSFMGMKAQGQNTSFQNTCVTNASAIGNCASAIGDSSKAYGFRSTAIGYRSLAFGSGSFAIGPFTKAGIDTSSSGGWAFGYEAQALGRESLAFGSTIQAADTQNIVIGMGTYPYLINSIKRSLMLGMNSNVPTFYMSNAGGGTYALSNIGIGTVSPAARMHINGTLRLGKTDSTTNGILEFENTTNTNIFKIESGPTAVSSFGWTLPATQGGADEVLTNNGSGALSWSDPDANAWTLTGNANADASSRLGATTTGVPLRIFAGNGTTERMFIDGSSGNVGIGTTTPDGLLHLNATNTYMIVEKGIDNEGGVVWHNGPQSAVTANASLMFETDETLRLRNAMINENVVINVNDGGTNREAIFVEGTSAHVGIGTSNPVTRLHVVALAATETPDDETIARFAVSDNDTAFIQLENIDDTNGHFAGGIRSISSTADNSALLIAAAVHPTIDTGSEPMMIFSPRRLGSTNITTRPLFEWANNSTSKMLMDASGNLGIGITGSTPQGKLEVNGTVLVADIPAGSGIPVYQNTTTGLLNDGTSSSVHFKEQIESLAFDKEAFLNMRPVSFRWKEFYGGQSDVGFVAQEVAESFDPLAEMRYALTYLPDGDIMRDDSTGLPVRDSTVIEPFGVKYHKLPVYLYSLAKHQDSVIQVLQSRMETLESMMASCCREDEPQHRLEGPDVNSHVMKGSERKDIVLLRNDPNPFSDFTDIKVSFSQEYHTASVMIVDMSSRMVTQFDVSPSQTVRVYSSEVGTGTFTYHLIVDGVIVKSGKMVSSR
jgi:hypothetical protein